MSPKLILLAKQIRKESHGWFPWNAPRWEELPERARNIWIGRAIRETLEETRETAQ